MQAFEIKYEPEVIPVSLVIKKISVNFTQAPQKIYAAAKLADVTFCTIAVKKFRDSPPA